MWEGEKSDGRAYKRRDENGTKKQNSHLKAVEEYKFVNPGEQTVDK